MWSDQAPVCSSESGRKGEKKGVWKGGRCGRGEENAEGLGEAGRVGLTSRSQNRIDYYFVWCQFA